MTWQDSLRIRKGLLALDASTQRTILDFASIQHLLRFGIFPAGAETPEAFAEAVALTDYGHAIVSKCSLGKRSPADIALACLMYFFHHQYLVDVSRSDVIACRSTIATEMNAGRLLLPERGLRELYDKFNNIPGDERLEHLDAMSTFELIRGTEQGVYQIGNLVTGPLGLLTCGHVRLCPPAGALPLYHCEDPGCGFLHEVRITRHSHPAFAALDVIRKTAKKTEGDQSEWDDITRIYFTRSKRRSYNIYNDLPGLLHEAFSDLEKAHLLNLALERYGPIIRGSLALSSTPNLSKIANGKIVQALSPSSISQLLLTLDEHSLIEIIDLAVYSRKIKVPFSEVRQPKSRPYGTTIFGHRCSLSNLGVRGDQREPIELFCQLVWEAYEQSDSLSELAWRCSSGDSMQYKSEPLKYLCANSVQNAMEKLILCSEPIVKWIGKRIGFEFDNSASAQVNIDRLLWKFGFNPPRSSARIDRLIDQIEEFAKQVVTLGSFANEDHRDAARSKGVNVFVLFERVLEEVIAFNIWLLASDHFSDTKFEYSHEDAVSLVGDVLGKSIVSGKFEAQWDPRGGNVIGVLLVYARAASNWMQQLSSKDPIGLKKSEDQLPFFVFEVGTDFPFTHRQLWADAARSELSAFAESFNLVIKQIEAASAAEVRNGLDHFRDEDRFPAPDRILASCDRLKRALIEARTKRIYPNNLWFTHVATNSFSMSEYELQDTSGSKIRLKSPSNLRGLKSVTVNQPLIVPHGNLLGKPNSELLFRVRERSEYSEKWREFPRRRMIAGTADTSA